MKYLAAILLMCFFFSCTEQIKKPLYVANQKPKKIASYPVQKGPHVLGYAHKYKWESQTGDFHHYYFVYNNLGEMIGYIGETGATEVYFPSGEKKDLGIHTKNEAASKIFETQDKFFEIPGNIRIITSNFDQERKPIVITSQGDSFSPSKRKRSKKYTKYYEEKENKFSNLEESEEESQKEEGEEQWPDSNEKWPGEKQVNVQNLCS